MANLVDYLNQQKPELEKLRLAQEDSPVDLLPTGYARYLWGLETFEDKLSLSLRLAACQKAPLNKVIQDSLENYQRGFTALSRVAQNEDCGRLMTKYP